ncbi:MAG: glycoside hydrolase domain-containing protein [Halobacteriaceae archaeon]
MVNLQVWPVDPLEKVFKDAPPPERSDGRVEVDAVRNEHATAQVAMRATEDIEGVDVSASPFSNAGGERIGEESLDVRLVGHVPVQRNTPDTPPEELLREAPADFPDPLFEETTFDLAADETRSIWLTVRTPKDAAEGTYEGTVTVTGGGQQAEQEVALTLHPVRLPDTQSLWLINYLTTDRVADYHGVRQWSEEFWECLESYAENMASHRQNVVNASLYGLVKFFRQEDGSLSFDFERFDRFVELFEDAGVVGRVSAGHLAGRPPKTYLDDEDAQEAQWNAEFESRPFAVRHPDGEVAYVQGTMKVSDPAFEEFLSNFLPSLQSHLEERGWLDAFLLDIADEPVDANAQSYNRIGELVRTYSPEIETIEPNQTHDIAESLDVWVPLLSEFDENRAFYEDQQREGDEVWHYTCLSPRGRYPNRFIDFSLVKVRILQWINFRYDLDGFLHWGYNHWTDDPFADAEAEPNHTHPLPPGDPFVVYPGEDGPIDSLRWEATRDAVEDYELLRLAAEATDEETVRAVCEEAVQTPTDYVRDPEELRSIRNDVIRLIEES